MLHFASVSSLTQQYRRATWLACAGAGCAALLLLGAPLLFGVYYYGLDLTRCEFGAVCALKQLLANDQALWLSPHLGNGGPLLARPSVQFFYPLRWLLLWAPVDLATSLYPVIHLALAAAGATWLGRSFGLRPYAAVMVGLTFALCGSCINLIFHANYIVAAAWLPLAWAACRRSLQVRRCPSGPVLLLVALVGCLWGSEPQAFCIASGLVCYESARRFWRSGRFRLGQRLAPLILVGAAFTLASVQWLAFYGESQLTTRSSLLQVEQALQWSFDPALWPAALLPNGPQIVHGHIWVQNPDNLFVEQGYVEATQVTFWNMTPYVGALFFVALVCGCALRRARGATAVFVVGLALSLGGVIPVLPLLMRLVPVFALFRYPQKYLVVTTLAATIVVALFLRSCSHSRRSRRRFALGAAVTLGALFLVLVVLWSGYGDAGPQHSRSLVHAMLPLLLALLLLLLVPHWRRWVVGLVALDVAFAALNGLPLGPPLLEYNFVGQALNHQRQDPAPIVCTHNMLEFLELGGLQASSWRMVAARRAFLLTEHQACDDVIAAVPYSPLQSSMNALLEEQVNQYFAAPARALGCTHLLSPHPPHDGGVERVDLFADGALAQALANGPGAYRIVSPVPLVFVARGAQLATTEQQVLQRVARAGSAAEVLQIADDPLRILPVDLQLPAADKAGSVEVLWPQRDRATVTIGGTGGAVVGLRTAFLVGWRAQQKGRPLPVIRVSGQHVATVVEDIAAGPIEFSYRPPYLFAGIGFMLFGAVASLVALWLYRRRGGSGTGASQQ